MDRDIFFYLNTDRFELKNQIFYLKTKNLSLKNQNFDLTTNILTHFDLETKMMRVLLLEKSKNKNCDKFLPFKHLKKAKIVTISLP